MRRVRALTFLVCLLCAAPLLRAAPAHAFVYWADATNNTIGRADNDGTGVDDAFIHTGPSPEAVAVDSGHIYWANEGGSSIGRANIDGTGVENEFIKGVSQPSGVAVNATSIYWSSLNTNRIGRANIDGTSPNLNLITVQEPCGVALDAGHVFWTSVGSPAYVGRASFNGLNAAPTFVTMNAAGPCGIAVNSANIFWVDRGFLYPSGTNIGRANLLDGKGVDDSIIGTASGPCGLTIDSSGHLYWANSGSGTIGRARTDATEVDESYIATGGGEICGVAIDSLSSPIPTPTPTPTPTPNPTPTPTPEPTPAPPLSQLKLGKVALIPKQGTATLATTVGGPGKLTLAGKGLAKVTKTIKRAGSAKLAIKATGAAAKALKNKGKATVKALVTFSQSGDTPLTLTRKIHLKRAPLTARRSRH